MEPNYKFIEFDDESIKQTISTGVRAKKIKMFDEYVLNNNQEQTPYEPKPMRPKVTRTSDAMTLCKQQEHFDIDFERDLYTATSRNLRTKAANILQLQPKHLERRNKHTSQTITMPNNLRQANPNIFNMKCENLMIASANEY